MMVQADFLSAIGTPKVGLRDIRAGRLMHALSGRLIQSLSSFMQGFGTLGVIIKLCLVSTWVDSLSSSPISRTHVAQKT